MGTPREKQPSAKIQWHPAFCAAAELELRSNKGDLEFKRRTPTLTSTMPTAT